jgi:tRNA(fMet)-specific endonuclease VapC
VSIISAGEQLQGRLAVIRRARTQADTARGFTRLHETIDFYQALTVVDYGEDAAKQFDALRAQGLRIGTQDLQIAAIALTTSAIVVTRNSRDFVQVSGLVIEDWTT